MQLTNKVEELQQLCEKRLDEQASMFHDLMNRKVVTLKDKLKMVNEKNKTLKRNIQRKKKRITSLKTVFRHLKEKKLLENDTVFRLTNEYGNLFVSLVQNEKNNIKAKSTHGHRFSEKVKQRFAATIILLKHMAIVGQHAHIPFLHHVKYPNKY